MPARQRRRLLSELVSDTAGRILAAVERRAGCRQTPQRCRCGTGTPRRHRQFLGRPLCSLSVFERLAHCFFLDEPFFFFFSPLLTVSQDVFTCIPCLEDTSPPPLASMFYGCIVVVCRHECLRIVKKERTERATHTLRQQTRVLAHVLLRSGPHKKELSRNGACNRDTCFWENTGPKKCDILYEKEGHTQGEQPRFHDVSAFLGSLRAWRLWGSVRVLEYLLSKGACGVATTQAGGRRRRDGRKRTPKSGTTPKNTRRKREIPMLLRLFESTFWHLFELGGPGLGCQMLQGASEQLQSCLKAALARLGCQMPQGAFKAA